MKAIKGRTLPKSMKKQLIQGYRRYRISDGRAKVYRNKNQHSAATQPEARLKLVQPKTRAKTLAAHSRAQRSALFSSLLQDFCEQPTASSRSAPVRPESSTAVTSFMTCLSFGALQTVLRGLAVNCSSSMGKRRAAAGQQKCTAAKGSTSCTGLTRTHQRRTQKILSLNIRKSRSVKMLSCLAIYTLYSSLLSLVA